jgi:S-adenosylmethionine-diacylglycerol 3-amino-3-carboxypropyl transferase
MKSISAALFEKIHGSNLIYNCCWEDPRIDREVLKLDQSSNVLVITSAGCNALDYLLAGSGMVNAVDMNFRQNALLELKVAAARALDYDEYFSMFGYGVLPFPDKTFRSKLRPLLTEQSQSFWDKHMYFFNAKGLRNSLYYHGTSGLVARCMKLYIDHFIDAKSICQDLLDAKDLKTQQEIYYKRLKPKLWSFLLRWVSNRTTVMAFLGVPKAQIEQVQKYHPRGMAGFIEDCIDKVFGELPIQDNYFWRVYLQGHYEPDCCPEYLTKAGHAFIKETGWQRLTINTSTIRKFLEKQPDNSFSHFVLLDHMDWLYSNLKEELRSEWGEILRVADTNARVIFRSGGYKVEYLDPMVIESVTGNFNLGSKLKYESELANQLHKIDRVHTYGSFYVAEITP